MIWLVDPEMRHRLPAKLCAGLATCTLLAVGAVATPAEARSSDQENLPPSYGGYYAGPPVVYGSPYGYAYNGPPAAYYGAPYAYYSRPSAYYYGAPYAYYGWPYYAPRVYDSDVGPRNPHLRGP